MEKVKEFIKNNWELIEKQDFETLYNSKSFDDLDITENGEVTSLFLDAGINPLDYLDYIPNYFLSCSNISEFGIPNHITKICIGAFQGCSLLKSITIPDSVIHIDFEVFEECSDDLVIKCKQDSYADEYAKENNIRVEYI